MDMQLMGIIMVANTDSIWKLLCYSNKTWL